MRSLWNGAVSFGLVHIPVKLYPATSRKDVSFNQLHGVCGSRIRYKRFCPHCNVEVESEDIVRGYEYFRNKYVVISDEELEQLPVAGSKTIEIKQFVRLEEIDPVFYDKTYYLEPAQGGGKPYALLREALRQTGRIAIASVVLRTKSSLCTLRIGGDALVMETMFYPDEIRSPAALAGLDHRPQLAEDEMSMAMQLIDQLTAPFSPERFEDAYRLALHNLIDEKIRGEEIAEAPVAAPTEKITDLMTALQTSLRQTADNGPETKRENTPLPVGVSPASPQPGPVPPPNGAPPRRKGV